MRWSLMAWFLVMGGCGNPVDLLSGVDGDSKAVTVEADSAPQAAPMALSHCSHYDRAAQFDGELSPGVFQYRCIAKE
jgi:hypothetical protein